MLKRYLTFIFIVLSLIILIVGLNIKIYWSGIVSWSFALISLIFAAYFTKYIPNKKD